MASSSDPVDNNDNNDPRIVLPTPGRDRGAKSAEPDQTPVYETPVEPVSDLPIAEMLSEFRLSGGEVPLLVAEAAALLNLAHTLRVRTAPPDLGTLRRETTQAVKEYEAQLASSGIVPEQSRAAHYIVCATLDDVIRNTPWGADWSVSGLVSTFHIDVTGGDRVFELLNHFQSNPGAHRDILMLIYLCLSLGFEGRTRVSARGSMELAQIRDGLYRTLRTQLGTFERDLSPRWQGEDAAHEPIKSGRLLWAIAGALVLTFTLLYSALSYSLNRSSDEVLLTFANLPPNAIPSIFIPDPPPPPVIPEVVEPEIPEVVPAPVLPPPPDPIEEFMAFLQREVDEGLVILVREGDAVLVRVLNTGAFASGSAVVEPDFYDVFDRIGTGIAINDFEVTIQGHTDSSRVGSGSRFASNFELSEARANAVRERIENMVGSSEFITVEGKGDTSPVATNDTIEGRQANRRTDIIVRKIGARVPPSLLRHDLYDGNNQDGTPQ
ncbi:type IVB secretion system protein IcmH/DotU [Parasulfitobacter algicola]|uniref:DotU family type IV/VI secretion system protein n=1 Tax=Parasulfitobacter algicola TaxID=2614809 RepID=A0ABX2IU69_9RHOB|nr:type IVB secretion system protein IcmH/DotU [Sulfitobacter algicola]NSX53728.1 DotU family type IV/VI secretion system protein [Sulfitobacter algicola]